MQFLFIYKGKDQKFNPEKLKRELAAIEGVSNINGENLTDSIVACDCSYNGYSTIVRLLDDLETVTTSRINDASFYLASELQKRESQPLRIFDDNYNFHFSIKGIRSPEELERKANEGYFDDEAVALENRVEEMQAA